MACSASSLDLNREADHEVGAVAACQPAKMKPLFGPQNCLAFNEFFVPVGSWPRNLRSICTMVAGVLIVELFIAHPSRTVLLTYIVHSVGRSYSGRKHSELIT
jgi:hypothetical protein